MGADLEYLDAMFRRLRSSADIERSFTIVRARTANDQSAVATNGASSNSVSVGSSSSVAEPPGT
jgi:hypothetical protein